MGHGSADIGKSIKIGSSLIDDIQIFLENRVAVLEDAEGFPGNDIQVSSSSASSATESDTEDKTLKDEADDGENRNDDHHDVDEKAFQDVENTSPPMSRNRVRFRRQDDGDPERRDDDPVAEEGHKFNPYLDFSPPRIPRNAPSHLIWSIFTKDREEKKRQKATKNVNSSAGKKAKSPNVRNTLFP